MRLFLRAWATGLQNIFWPQTNVLKTLGLLVVGVLLAIFCLFQVNTSYVHVYQRVGEQELNQRELKVSIQPFWPSPVIDLFHAPSKSDDK